MPTLQTMVLPTAALLVGLAMPTGAHAQVTRNGGLDPSFGGTGKATLAFPGDLFLHPDAAVDVALLPGGGLIVAGTVVNAAGNEDFAAIRLTASGELDSGYGVNGGRRIGFDRAGSDLHDRLAKVLTQPDGKVILAGSANGNPATDESDMALVRLTAAGALDASFGTGGRALVAFNLGAVGRRGDYGTALALQDDGKILLAGGSESGTSDQVMAVVRLNGNGQRDTSFDGDGRASIDFGPDYGFATATQVRQLADGGILLAGFVLFFGDQGVTADFALARLLANGAPDPGFGAGGKVVFGFDVGGREVDGAYDVVELPDGTLLACGLADVAAPANADMACMRFLANGAPDPGFAAVLVPFDRGGDLVDSAARIALDDQGRIVLGGAASVAADNDNFAIARLHPDGELDLSFGNGGTVTYNSCNPLCFPSDRDNPGTTLAVQDDGRIIAAGRVRDGSGNYRFLVARLIGDVLFSDGFED